jgi:hypothetical protein
MGVLSTINKVNFYGTANFTTTTTYSLTAPSDLSIALTKACKATASPNPACASLMIASLVKLQNRFPKLL